MAADLRNALGLNIDASILKAKVGSAERFVRNADISRLDTWLLGRAVAPIAKTLGYK